MRFLMSEWGPMGSVLAIVALAVTAACPRTGNALLPQTHIAQYGHTRWNVGNDSIGAPSWNIVQTTDGYLWFSSDSGLFRFDGVRFIKWSFPGNEKLSNAEIFAILATTDGSLWMADLEGGLWQYRDQKLTAYHLPDHTWVVQIIEAQDGKVWLTRLGPKDGAGPVCEAGRGQVKCYKLSEPLASECCAALADGMSGDLWLSDRSHFLIKWSTQGSSSALIRLPVDHVYATAIRSIAPISPTSAWIGFETPGQRKGLQFLDHGKWRSFRTENWDSSSIGVHQLLLDHHGALWVGTDSGVYRIYDNKVEHFGKQEGLTDDRVYGLFEDHEGDLWAATMGGIDCFHDLAVVTFQAGKDLQGPEFDDVYATRDGRLWIGGAGALNSIVGTSVLPPITGHKLPGKQITAILEDHNGQLWVGADDTLSLFRNGSFSRFNRPDRRPIGWITGLTEDNDRTIWAEVNDNGRHELAHISNGRMIQILHEPEMPYARRLVADQHGSLWMGLMSGNLARYRNGHLDIFKYPQNSGSPIFEVTVDSGGAVLAATSHGVLGWRDGKQQVLTSRNGLRCESVNTLVIDRNQSLWLRTQCGMVEIPASEVTKWWNDGEAALKTRVFDTFDGVEFGRAAFQGATRTPDGKLWFVNGVALQMIDPDHLPSNRVVPPVKVEELTVNGVSYSPSPIQRFPKFTRDIAIRYTGLSYVAPQKVRFRYKLEGQDTSWQEAGTRREAFYTNLAPGAYTFRVIACNNDGLWNEIGDSVSFSIAPAYYQTRWFNFLCIAMFAALLWIFYLFRLRQATVRVQERLGARMEERERIARELHDTLLQGFQGLMLRFQAVMNILPKDGPAQDAMEAALTRADEVLLEGRQHVKDLRSEGTAADDLIGLLAKSGEEFGLHQRAQFSLAVIGSPVVLDPAVSQDAYRIGCEAIANAYQHAEASKIEVEISYSHSVVRLRVRDDGKGVNQDTLDRGREGHWGLAGMRERARNIGAKLDIWSHIGAGTEIELEIPAKIALLREPVQQHQHRRKHYAEEDA